MTHITLNELHDNILRTSYKNDAIVDSLSDVEKQGYLREHFPDNEYYTDNWYMTKVPLPKLISANTEFRELIFFNKNEPYVSQWPHIKKQLSKKWLMPKRLFDEDSYRPITARESSEQKGYFYVWDGQRRTLNAFWYKKPYVLAYAFKDK